MNTKAEIIDSIRNGRTAMGLELGSTRIKAVLIDETHTPIASGSYEWENRLEDGIWTYDLEDAWTGIRACYRELADQVEREYGVKLTTMGSMGFSGMMHGYIPFDREGRQLAGFRTWRNTITGEAAELLSPLFHFNVPQRWSIAHLCQAALNGEEHVKDIAFLSTLAVYVHWKLTGRKCAGVGEASGMFPIDPAAGTYDAAMMKTFDGLMAERGYSWRLEDILPRVLMAGEDAGCLTAEGAMLLDPTGTLQAGIPVCPPEGDAGTGMAATNSVAPRTGNVSAGTSVFAMLVMERDLRQVHPEIDVVTTPDGRPVAMVHCNNCTSDLNAWVGIFEEFAAGMGIQADRSEIFGMLYRKALEGDPDAGGLLAYNCFSGEPVVGLNEDGRPLFTRRPDSRFNLANFMRANLFAALGTLKVGLDILRKEEQVEVDEIYGHGGLFKTPVVGQKILAAAIQAPVSVMETAGEGGPWGMALLAGYRIWRSGNESLGDYLKEKVFAGAGTSRIAPDAADKAGFERFTERYLKGLPIEKSAVEYL